MKIGIDARLYGTSHAGIGRYIKELILNLLKIDRENQYVFFVYNDKDKREIITDIQSACDGKNISFVLAPFRWYSLKEQLFLTPFIKKTNVDLMHFPHFNVPFFYNDPYIVTIHDLIIHHFPDERATTLPRWLYRLKLMGYKKVIKHAVMNARAIIAPSEFTKNDILEFYNINEKKIKVICEGTLGLNSALKIKNYKLNITLRVTARRVENLKLPARIASPARFESRLPAAPACAPRAGRSAQAGSDSGRQCEAGGKIKNYLLYVGSAYPHKNLERLIDAFAILYQKYNLTNLQLVLVGKIDYFYNQLRKYISTHYQLPTTHCYFYGHADDSELAQLYKNAKLFIFPSLYEGFGLPPLEAMSFGTPVVASNLTSIPEICGSAALYFDPNDADDIAAKIYSVIASDLPALLCRKAKRAGAKQSLLRQKGFEQIKKYSWEKMAEETLQVYKNVVSNCF